MEIENNILQQMTNATNTNESANVGSLPDQQQQEINLLNSIDCLPLNDQSQMQPIQNFLDLITSATQNMQQTPYTNMPPLKVTNNMPTMSIKTSPTVVENHHHQQQQQQQQQTVQSQVQTIMLNGQPALFIPASSSNIICQILMNSNQICDFLSPSQQQQHQQQSNFQFQLAQPNNSTSPTITFGNDSNVDLMALLASANQQNILNSNAINLASNQIQLNTNTNQTNNNPLAFIQLNPFTTNSANQSTSNGTPTLMCKLEPTDLNDLQNNSTTFLQLSFDSAQHEQQQTQQTYDMLKGKKPRKQKTTTTPITQNTNKKGRKLFKKLKMAENNDGSNNNNTNGSYDCNLNSGDCNDTTEKLANELNSILDSQKRQSQGNQHENVEFNSNNLIQDEIQYPWLIFDGNILNGEKRKRKACECPNCIRWKLNELPPDDALNKKRTHKCHKCGKEYNKTSHLRAHLRAHDNYRPYVCDFALCGKSFTRSDELKRHKRIHNDDRNFPCLICKKKFLRSDHLSKHILVHNRGNNNNSNVASSTQSPTKTNNSKTDTNTQTTNYNLTSPISSPSSSVVLKLNAVD